MALKVIGAGLGRTGTSSLKLALETLGLGPCYHMMEVHENADFVRLWQAAAAGNPDWDAIFKNYQASTDYPACNYWQEHMVHFPQAKVIMTVRDANTWFDSVHATIMSPQIVAWTKTSPLADFFDSCVYRDFGDHINERAFMVDYFEQRIETIKASVPSEKLLVFEVEQGWLPLCDFLDVPVPDTDFPRVNHRAETSARIDSSLLGAGGNSR